MNEFSDHCRLFFSLQRNCIDQNVEYNNLDKEKYIKWDEEKISDFKQLLSSKSNDIDMMKCEIDNDCDIEDVIKWFNDFMQENSYTVFGK